jgi:hypothetical protein
MKHIWSVLCRKSIIDSETNNISLNDVFEQLSINIDASANKSIKTKINIPVEFEVVSMWLNTTGQKIFKAEMEVNFVTPEGTIINSLKQNIEVSNMARRLRTRLKSLGLGVGDSGTYTFEVKIKEYGEDKFKTVAKIPLEVIVNKKEVTNPIDKK